MYDILQPELNLPYSQKGQVMLLYFKVLFVLEMRVLCMRLLFPVYVLRISGTKQP